MGLWPMWVFVVCFVGFERPTACMVTHSGAVLCCARCCPSACIVADMGFPVRPCVISGRSLRYCWADLLTCALSSSPCQRRCPTFTSLLSLNWLPSLTHAAYCPLAFKHRFLKNPKNPAVFLSTKTEHQEPAAAARGFCTCRDLCRAPRSVFPSGSVFMS